VRATEEEVDSILWMHSFDMDCAKEFGASEDQIVLIRNFEPRAVVYKGKAKAKSLHEWYKT